jgi:hypothetical protein
VAVACGVALVVGALLWLVALPLWLRARLVEEARKSGVVLSVGWVRLGWGSAEARELVATAPAIPAATLHAPIVRVALAGLSPESLSVENARLEIEGDVESFAAGLVRFRAALPAAPPGGDTTLRRVSVQNTRIDWKAPTGGSSELHVADLGGEATRGPGGWSDWHYLAQDLTLDLPPLHFGPWSLRVQHDAAQTLLRLALAKRDDGPRVEIVFPADPERQELHVRVPRSPTRSLGVPEGLLLPYGLADAEVSLELDEVEDRGRGQGRMLLDLWHYRLPQGGRVARGATTAGLDLAWEGPMDRMPLGRGTGRFGPFSGPMTGWIARPRGALAFDLVGRSQVATCASALEAAARDLAGDAVVRGVQDLAALLGAPAAAPVKGDIAVETHASYDTRAPLAAKATIVPRGECRLELFP